MHLLLYLKYWKSKLSGIYSTFIGGDISGNPDFLFIAGLEWWWSRLSLCHETKLQQLQTRGKPNHNARYPQTLRFMIGLPHFLAFISGGVTWATDGCIRHSNINPYHPCHPNHQISSKFTSFGGFWHSSFSESHVHQPVIALRPASPSPQRAVLSLGVEAAFAQPQRLILRALASSPRESPREPKSLRWVWKGRLETSIYDEKRNSWGSQNHSKRGMVGRLI